MFTFQPERLDENTKLGEGRFGKVFPYQKEQQDFKWVVKRIHAGNINVLLACLPEIALGIACDHPCIVPVKGYFIEKIPNSKSSFYIYMKMPRMKETLLANFEDKEKENRSYSEEEIIRHFYSLAHGIGYLHSKKIYHGEIKPENLLIDHNGSLRIGDVGIQKRIEGDPYSAPEIIVRKKMKKDILTKADIWSLGVVILELCAFNSKLLNAALPQELQGEIDESLENLEEGKYSVALTTLIKKLLSLDPNERPDAEMIKVELEKNFLQFLDKDLVYFNKVDTTQFEDEIKILKKEKQEISEKFEKSETERKELKDLVSQLERSLSEQRQQYEARVKELTEQAESRARESSQKEATHRLDQERIATLEGELHNLRDELQEQLHAVSSKVEQLNLLGQKVQDLEQEKTVFQRRNNDLETDLTTARNQAENYENQIRTLQESHLRLSQEKEGLLNSLNSLENKVEQMQKIFYKNYEKNLQIVASELSERQTSSFQVVSDKKILKIHSKASFNNTIIKDEHLNSVSKDLIAVLQANNLLNLEGLEIHCNGCYGLTDKSFEHLKTALSTQSLTLKSLHLDFSNCDKLTVKSLEYLANALSTQSPTLQTLHLYFFGVYVITKNTKLKFEKAIKTSHPNLQSFEFKFGMY